MFAKGSRRSPVKRGVRAIALATAVGVGAAAPAVAAPPAGNLLANPDAEVAPSVDGSGNYTAPSGWTATTSNPADQGPYDSCYGGGADGERMVVEREVGAAIGGGVRGFFGGQVSQSALAQDIAVAPGDVAGRALLIGGDFGGYEGQADDVTLAVSFLDAGGADLGSAVGTVAPTAADRGSATSLLHREAAGTVPAGTSRLHVVLTQTRHEGSDNDGYADNLYLTFDGTAPARAAALGDPGCPLQVPPPPVVTPPVVTPTPIPPVVVPPPPAVKPPTKKRAAKKPALTTVVRGLPSTKRCLSRRAFRIRLRNPKGTKITTATVKVNGKTVATRKGKRVTAPVNLKGLPKGRYTVSITTHLANGKTVKGSRHYRTCTPKHGSRKH
jgi:hypothetical protein